MTNSNPSNPDSAESESRTPESKFSSARTVAADALLELEKGTDFGDELLSRHLTNSALRGSDRALAADLFWGTTRWRGRIDSVVSPTFRGDYARSNPLIRVLLRMGAYQLFCQDRVPDHAAVSQTVEIAVKRLGKTAAGLVNAILRRMARERERWTTPPENCDNLGRLSFFYSHPRWIVRELVEHFGMEEAERALELNNTRPALTVYVNRLNYTEKEFEIFLAENDLHFQPSKYLKGYYRLETSALAHIQFLLDNGKITVQDESAGLAVELLDPISNERVVDLCAAPGGKSIAIYQKFEGKGKLYSVEESAERFNLLGENMERVDAAGVRIIHADARTYKEEPFDKVLADVPCSSLGLLRKRPDIRWRRKSYQLELQQELQTQILENAAKLTKPGGVLVYSTCSIMPSENSEIVNTFLNLNPNFHREDARGFLPESVVNEQGDMETFSHKHGTDGAYASRLRKSA